MGTKSHGSRAGGVLAAFCLLGSGCQSTSGPLEAAPAAKAAMQLPADREAGQRIYGGACVACHGDDGSGNEAALVPRIAGQHYSVVIRQLADFRTARRRDPRMEAATMDHRLESPQALANIATYVNLLKARPRVNLGGTQFGDLGQRLYETNCASCHGGAAEGDDAKSIPRLAGQNRSYLIRQFRDIGGQLRAPAGRSHAALLEPLDYQKREALADFLARML